MHYKKTDYILFALIIAAVLFLAVFSLDNSCSWGDDFAAYISEGISIADGYFDEQIKLNVRMHPSKLTIEDLDEPLVYVWGYPLLMALVYKLVGFDRAAFSSIIYYKLPSAIALALLAGVMYLFLRRRFGRTLSFTLAFLFCTCNYFRTFLNSVYSDLVFLLLVALSLLISEIFLCEEKPRKKIALGLALGVALWFTYETRLNGISVLFVCAVACVAYLIRNGKQTVDRADKRRTILCVLLPFALFLVLKFISEAILAPATSNSGDLKGFALSTVLYNAEHYYECIRSWITIILDDAFFNYLNGFLTHMTKTGEDTYGVIQNLCTTLNTVCVTAILLMTLAGLLIDGIKRELHLTLFVIIYSAVVCMLPYVQGERYIFPIMMLIPLYFGYMLKHIAVLIYKFANKKTKVWHITGKITATAVCVLIFVSAIQGVFYWNNSAETTPDIYGYKTLHAYNPCAIETYRYLIDNTPDDCIIGFTKPRALYLNTQRVSVRPDVNGHTLDEVDYYLSCTHFETPQLQPGDDFKVIYSNAEFVLYEKIK